MTPTTLVPALLLGCGASLGDEYMGMEADEQAASVEAEEMPSEPSPDALGNAMPGRAAPQVLKGIDIANMRGGLMTSADAAPADEPADDPGQATQGSDSVRTWFPEAFLWEPRVHTGEDGLASVDVTVPDQLTTWRVLALAHDRTGQQAGTVHTFDTRLPIYVEPVVPGWLIAGDRLVLPVQAVNGGTGTVTAALQVRASGAMRGLGTASIRLTPGSSDVRYIPLRVTGAGDATIRAELRTGSDRDAAQRVIRVQPAGRPEVRTFGSTLANTRTFTLDGAQRADPATEELSIAVFPGPLAVVQAELERLQGGAEPSAPGYGFALATHAATLAEQAAVELDPDRQRRAQLLAWQRVVYQARTTSPVTAARLLQAIEGTTLELVDGVRPHLQRVLVDQQRADGTWSVDASSTLQRVLVETAVVARALPASEAGARLRAMGAIERHARDISDAYTASVVLAAGLAEGPAEEHLQGILVESLRDGPTGARTLDVPPAAAGAGATSPTRAEGLAWAILALSPEHPARGDLISELMTGWSAERGFGAGAADPIALEAVVAALSGANEPVQIVLSQAGRELSRGRLDPAQPRQPVTLDAKPRDGELTLTATPPVPGLAFVATRRSWVPWSATEPGIAGVDVEVSTTQLVRGQEGTLRLVAAAPSGTRLTIEQGLPAGADARTTATWSLEPGPAGTRDSVVAFSDRVRVTTAAFGPGEIKEIEIPVTPGFAGRFQTPPLRVSVVGGPTTTVRPLVWRVRAE